MKRFGYDKDFEFAGRADLRQRTETLLASHLRYCQIYSPYYRELLRGFDFSADSFPMEDLPSLPFTGRDALSADPGRLLAIDEAAVADIVFSSGTTGKPVPIFYSPGDMERLAYNEEKAFRNCGMHAGDRVLLTCTMDRCFIAGMAYYLGTQALGAAAIRNGLNTLESHAAVIGRLCPTVLIGVPSFLLRLARYLSAEGIRHDSVRMLVCIGEPVRDVSFELNSLGGKLAESWRASVISTYASSEIVSSFCDCECGGGGHVPSDLAVLEIVDDAGRSLGAGELGEVVITPLQTEAMPLLRFRTGDMSFFADTPCKCGRLTPRLGPIVGRKQQMMKINGTTVFPQTIFNALDELEEVSAYYLEAYCREPEGLYRAVVHLSLKDSSADVAQLKRRVQAVARVSIPVLIESEQDVNDKIFGGKSRKPVKFFVVSEKEECRA
ncbi:MAG: hypothetical protein A2X49_16515 [Lentisphaerae bacterium GWF2_52_8]|nr:MAG: hypothetical protein A2X49_16515 [Lentisphaerae bacterium GWF2_52_8]